MSPPRTLTIAGSDSGGGAGIQADLKTFLSLGTYGLSVLTALTAQNTTGVSAIHAPPPEFVVQQIDAVTSDIHIDAVKIGMLCNHDILVAVAHRLEQWKNDAGEHGGQGVPVVLDPVMVSTSGSMLLSQEAVAALIRQLLPLCTLLTPNLPEAKQLLHHAATATATNPTEPNEVFQLHQSTDIAAMMEAAQKLAGLGPAAVLVKGGHAKLSRSQVLEQIAQLTADSTTAQSTFANQAQLPAALGAARVDFPARVPRRQGEQMSGSSASTAERRQSDLARLAGLDGASITCSGNVAIVRTDAHPFSAILGGGTDGDAPVVCDVLYEADGGQFTLFLKPHVSSTATHGTGCTLSSAIAASLAQGHSLLRATAVGIDYVQRAIAGGGISDLGAGSGPLDHSFPLQRRPLPAPSAAAPYPLLLHLIANSQDVWGSYTRSAFVESISGRTIFPESFIYFLRQDYIFLRHYARLWSAAASMAGNSFERIATFASIAVSMGKEAEMHVSLCEKGFGVSRQQLEEGTNESMATLAYTRFVEGVGRGGQGGLLDLLVALAPCLCGYGEVGIYLGRREAERGSTGEGDSSTFEQGLRTWIRGYAGEEFQTAVKEGMELIEQIAAADPPSPTRLHALQRTWNAACRLEIGMWDEAMRPEVRRDVLDP